MKNKKCLSIFPVWVLKHSCFPTFPAFPAPTDKLEKDDLSKTWKTQIRNLTLKKMFAKLNLSPVLVKKIDGF